MSDASPGFLARRVASFRYAFRGLAHLFREETNARIHALAIVLVFVFALGLGIPREQIAVLVLAIGLVLGLEAINSALEALCDRVAPEMHPLVARCKDTAAAAVLIAALAAATAGFLIMGPPLWARLVGGGS